MLIDDPTDEGALIEAAAREIALCESSIELVLRPLSAMHLAGVIQLALRHPELERLHPASGVTARTALEHIRAYFRDQGAAAIVEMLRRGDDPRQDR